MNPKSEAPVDSPPRDRKASGKAPGRRRRYDPTLVVQLYTDGSTMAQVAAKAGCHTRTVARVLQDAGVPRRRRRHPPAPPPPALTPPQTAKVVRMYTQSGLEVWQIIRRTSQPAPSVKLALSEAGIAMRRGKAATAGWPDADIAYRYQRGDSIAQIATHFGMAHHTVRTRLDAAGVPRRPPPRTPDDVQADFVHRYTQLHQPIGRIAKQTSRSRTAVTRALIAAGYLPTPQPQATPLSKTSKQ